MSRASKEGRGRKGLMVVVLELYALPWNLGIVRTCWVTMRSIGRDT